MWSVCNVLTVKSSLKPLLTVSSTFIPEKKSSFKLERNKVLAFIMIIIDIDWYEQLYCDNCFGHISQPYMSVFVWLFSRCVSRPGRIYWCVRDSAVAHITCIVLDLSDQQTRCSALPASQVRYTDVMLLMLCLEKSAFSLLWAIIFFPFFRCPCVFHL